MSSAIKVEIFDSSPEMNLKTVPIMELLFSRSIITAEALIRERVARELERAGGIKEKEQSRPLVPLTEQEHLLNQRNSEAIRDLLEVHCKRAIKAFQGNEFFIIVDDQQITGLNEEFAITDTSKVEFFRLRRLVGGKPRSSLNAQQFKRTGIKLPRKKLL